MNRLPMFLLCTLFVAACSTPPTPTGSASPTSISQVIPTIEVPTRTARFETEDGVILSGTLFGQGPIGVVLSHMQPGDQKSWHAFARLLAENGYLALAYDFRGYGESGGIQELGLIDRDVRAAVAFMREQGAENIILIGASMGGTASAKVAGELGVDMLIVLSSPQRFEAIDVTKEDLADLRGPSLWMSSQSDPVTRDVQSMQQLAARPATLHIYDGIAHGMDIFNSSNGEDLTQRLMDFISEVFPPLM